MYPITFQKERAEELLSAIDHNRAITPRGEKWTAEDLALVAGACASHLYGVIATRDDGTRMSDDSIGERTDLDSRDNSRLIQDVLAGVQWVMSAMVALRTDQHDDMFHEKHRAVVRRGEHGKLEILPVDGFKDGWSK